MSTIKSKLANAITALNDHIDLQFAMVDLKSIDDVKYDGMIGEEAFLAYKERSNDLADEIVNAYCTQLTTGDFSDFSIESAQELHEMLKKAATSQIPVHIHRQMFSIFTHFSLMRLRKHYDSLDVSVVELGHEDVFNKIDFDENVSGVAELWEKIMLMTEKTHTRTVVHSDLDDFFEARTIISAAFNAGWITTEDLITQYKKIVNELVEAIGSDDFKEKLQQLYDASFTFRAAISNCDELVRETVMSDIVQASRPLIRKTLKCKLLRENVFQGMVAREELRGFLASLDVSPDLAKKPLGAILEISIHRSKRYDTPTNLDRLALPAAFLAFLQLGFNTALNIPVSAIGITMGVSIVGTLTNKIKEGAMLVHDQYIPYRPNRQIGDYLANNINGKMADTVDTAVEELSDGLSERMLDPFYAYLDHLMGIPLDRVDAKEVLMAVKKNKLDFFTGLSDNNLTVRFPDATASTSRQAMATIHIHI